MQSILRFKNRYIYNYFDAPNNEYWSIKVVSLRIDTHILPLGIDYYFIIKFGLLSLLNAVMIRAYS